MGLLYKGDSDYSCPLSNVLDNLFRNIPHRCWGSEAGRTPLEAKENDRVNCSISPVLVVEEPV